LPALTWISNALPVVPGALTAVGYPLVLPHLTQALTEKLRVVSSMAPGAAA
jgi:hypothetical protein